MAPAPSATWKHRDGGPLPEGPIRVEWVAILGFFLLVLLLTTLPVVFPTRTEPSGPATALMLAIDAAVALPFIRAVRRGVPTGSRIGLYDRYLICGPDIVYFHNVVLVTLDRQAGVLSLDGDGGRVFRLRRDGFTTKARKPHKIQANKDAKFLAVSEKVISRIAAVSPQTPVHDLEPGSR